MIEKIWAAVEKMGGGIALLVIVLLIAVCVVAFTRLRKPSEPPDKSNPAGEP